MAIKDGGLESEGSEDELLSRHDVVTKSYLFNRNLPLLSLLCVVAAVVAYKAFFSVADPGQRTDAHASNIALASTYVSQDCEGVELSMISSAEDATCDESVPRTGQSCLISVGFYQLVPVSQMHDVAEQARHIWKVRAVETHAKHSAVYHISGHQADCCLVRNTLVQVPCIASVAFGS
eukprot:TRINITY_DN18288_c0_g1_i1.p1 TRINITY_DN18288_c0_g1~~TRINITY_DN18288_c0_g1_i1.p1  ORF type:complete len:178 (+),score=12.12 TRINITY_DN18288_c0_g1_i1:253-786(+)